MRRASFARHAQSTLREAMATVEAARAEERRQAVERREEAAQAERDRPKLTRDDVEGATHVRDRFGWREVVRVNASSVTVRTAYSWDERIALARVLEVRR